MKRYNHNMDTKSKIVLIMLTVLTVVSISYTFYKTVILQDFEVVNMGSADDTDASEEE